MTRNIVMYAFGPAKESYKVKYHWIFREDFSIDIVRQMASVWTNRDPSISGVYLVDDTTEVYREWNKLKKNQSLENFVIFKCWIESVGLKVM